MPSVKLQGSITLPDGSTTGPFTINLELLPTTVALHVTPSVLVEAGVEEQQRRPEQHKGQQA